ncbi:hypothetical protein EDB19DRAFT_1905469 [Suillus lakei]|nr:hypothetical protein EDB19DRAFT_1905469 [Suillus lakei]
MKDKEPTSLKAISQATRPYPTTPCLPSQSSKSGPKYFPPDVLLEEDLECTMDLIPYMPDPPFPPSPPDTPTPAGHVNHVHPLKPDLLVYQEFSMKPHNPSNSGTPTTSLASSIHTPSNPTVDHTMNDPLSPSVNHAPTPEEQAILAHLVLSDMNRSVLSQNGTTHSTTLPQFTPAPNGGFPTVHMSHLAQIFNHLDNRVLLTWFQVEHLKFMIRVFDHSGKDVAEHAAIIA